PYGPPPGALPPPTPARGPGALVFVLIAATVVVLLLIGGVGGYLVLRDGGGDAEAGSSGPVDLRVPLTFSLVSEVSQPPCGGTAQAAADGSECYTFGSDTLTVRRLEQIKASAPDPAQGASGWTVQLTLTSQDTPKFGALTGKAAQAYAGRQPASRMGMLVGGALISDPPQVMQAITEGQVQISGSADKFTQAYVHGLVRRMTGA
ncbi:SecDF P1 head subdomain-containing protein, partial [Actinomadura darangshiensis]|uniref:SecDF P1 head subdomain-containing protein n=1 Tax=Actinomadura darangshiensis TaxID=705336 RepID=UPI003C7A40B2